MGDMKFNPSVEWKLKQHKTFSVTANAWMSGDKWNWNVYALIYESHPLFNEPGYAIQNLPFHGGCTFDKVITFAQSGGNEYDKRDPVKTLKLGSDYAHLNDDYDNHPSGFDGIPYNIERDAQELFDTLLAELDKAGK